MQLSIAVLAWESTGKLPVIICVQEILLVSPFKHLTISEQTFIGINKHDTQFRCFWIPGALNSLAKKKLNKCSNSSCCWQKSWSSNAPTSAFSNTYYLPSPCRPVNSKSTFLKRQTFILGISIVQSLTWFVRILKSKPSGLVRRRVSSIQPHLCLNNPLFSLFRCISIHQC